MRSSKSWFVILFCATVACIPPAARATDVDGADDCTRTPIDFGDAPEGIFAYPGILGTFPTCLAFGAVGVRDLACAPISSAPVAGASGFVRHVHAVGVSQYWLGCVAAAPLGIDSEPNGKVNDTGGAFSACIATLAVDCVEPAFGMNFGQDECYGTNDACLGSRPAFTTCTSTSVTFNAYNCATFAREVYLNILVDWNKDGDWNDNFQCPGGCSYEWAVKNVLVTLPPGCNAIPSPAFLAGPNVGDGWMRITLSDQPVVDDYPWAGSATMPGQSLANGETEDYPISVNEPTHCPDWEDWGDAPEEIPAYPGGILGRFPTCAYFAPPGTRELACPPISTIPGPTGYVRHLSGPADPMKFWLGCGNPSIPTTGVDSEINGKTNSTGGAISACATGVLIDCVEAAFGMSFGQDECYGDPPADAGVLNPVIFTTCTASTVTFNATNCGANPIEVYLNILVDWNEDGDWNDNFECPSPTGTCAYEWSVKNVLISLPPGCTPQISPPILAGPRNGNGWMRITLTEVPVTDDFPWNGSFGPNTDFFRGGETEDYPVTIKKPQNCDIGYRDFGDAPEDFAAYSAAIIGHFPTCLTITAPGDQVIECGTALSTVPGPTGYVEHLALPSDPIHYWLGCAVDAEADGKTNLGGAAGSPSLCNPLVTVDCTDGLGGMLFGQDECYGDADAALAAPVAAENCTLLTVPYYATLCENQVSTVYLNILADWNGDGDWNDNVVCKDNICSVEWVVKNAPVTLTPGCNLYSAPTFATGPYVGLAWMRMTLSSTPAPDDFPWNGTASIGNFIGGETEDYLIRVLSENPLAVETDRRGGVWLGPVVPNPARDQATLDFSLPRDANTELSVFDLTGRRVAQLINGHESAGTKHVSWDFRDAQGRAVPIGYYVFKLRVGDEVLTRRVIRVK